MMERGDGRGQKGQSTAEKVRQRKEELEAEGQKEALAV
jgi:hypothetical protein